MKILSPHRRKMEASRRFGGKEFQNKIKKAQGYKRVLDPRTQNALSSVLRALHLDSRLMQLFALAVAGAAAYFLFISPYFLVTQIEVSGNSRVGTDQIVEAFRSQEGSRWMLVPRNHLLLMGKSSATNLLSEKTPLVREIEKYRRVWPNKIKVTVIERNPAFVFSAAGKNYLIDDEGVVVKEIQDVSGMSLVVDQVNESLSVGERLNNAKLVGFLQSGFKNWPSKVNSKVKEVKVPGKAANQVQFVSEEGWGVFFDITRPVETQLANLNLILSRQIPAQSRLKLVYIDLRFDKWAYYCYKNSPCEAQPQLPNEPAGDSGEMVEDGGGASGSPEAANAKKEETKTAQ